jgi:hypothetical protein
MTESIFLHPAHDAAFRRDGFLVLDLLDDEDISELAAVYEPMAEMHQYPFMATLLLPDLAARQTIHAGLSQVYQRRLLPLLRDYRTAIGSFVVKQGRSKIGSMPLHQDSSFVDEQTLPGITVWCPLVETTPENGWIGVVPGSHILPNPYREPCSLSRPELHELIESRFLHYLAMRPGQVLFMDNRLFHASPPNRSSSPRVAAGGVVVPQRHRLICCYLDASVPKPTMEVYEVPEDFYLRHTMRTRPAEGWLVDAFPLPADPLSEDWLSAHCRPLVADAAH